MSNDPPITTDPIPANKDAWKRGQLANAVSCRFGQDTVLWAIIGSFWSTNAVLLVALFATGNLPESQIVKILVCGSGVSVSFVWLIMQAAALRRIIWYEKVIKRLEVALAIPGDVRIMSGADPEHGAKNSRLLPQARKVMPFAPPLVLTAWSIALVMAVLPQTQITNPPPVPPIAASSQSYPWELLQAILTGVVTAGTIAAFGYIYVRVRDWKLKRLVIASIQQVSHNYSKDGHGISVNNQTYIPIIIRSVELRAVAEDGHPTLQPGHEIGTIWLDYFGPAERLPPGRTRDTQDNERSYVELMPYTGGKWLTPVTDEPPYPNSRIAYVEVTVEYMTLLKRPMLMLVKFESPGIEHLFPLHEPAPAHDGEPGATL